MKLTSPITFTTFLLVLAPTLIHAWTVEIFDEDCVTSVDAPTGTTDYACTDTPNPHDCFTITDMNTCTLYLYPDTVEVGGDCDDQVSQQLYNNLDEDECICPMSSWNAFEVDC